MAVETVDKQSVSMRTSARVRKNLPAHLDPQYGWKPGVSGNPKGRPRGLTFTEVARKYLGEEIPGETELTRMGKLVHVLYDLSVEGNMKACKLLLERVDPAKQRIDQTTLKVLQIHITRQSEAGLDARAILDAATQKPLLEAVNDGSTDKDR